MAAKFSNEVLWTHPDPETTEIYRFMQEVNRDRRLQLKTFKELHDYSITNISDFYSRAFRWVNLVHEGDYTQVVNESAPINSVPEWFRGIHLNFAENILYSGPPMSSSAVGDRSTTGKEDHKIAVSETTESGGTPVHVSWGQLRTEVVQIANAMKAYVRPGDRVAVVSSNSLDTLKVFLGVTALGGIFSSSSPDMGVKAQLDRLLQIEPVLVFCDDSMRYNGKYKDLRDNIAALVNGLKDMKVFKRVVVMSRSTSMPLEVTSISKSTKLADFLGTTPDVQAVDAFKFKRVPFKAPFLIAYSSGTTGNPKCILHSVGGVLLSHAIHITLHVDIGPSDTVLQFTTTGWIVYVLQVLFTIRGARLVLYDGSPFYPDAKAFLQLLGREKVSVLGTSSKWISEIEKRGICPRDIADLSSLREILPTGSVLPDNLFRWIYQKGFPPSIHLNNVSGGTDICGAFATGNYLDPVYVGGMQCAPLGMAVTVFEEQEGVGIDGRVASPGVAGELVCTKAFPNMPPSFWGADGQEKYFQSYFQKFNGVWTQGDNIVALPGTARLNFIGRSDGVLNPAGIRFGASEIYSVLEQKFSSQIADSVAVGQRRPHDREEKFVLFLMMMPGQKYSAQLVQEVKQAIRVSLTPRHVPAFVFETPDIPRTINMKKAELPVKKILCGTIVQPSSTLVNPECLDFYYQFVDIEKMARVESKL